VAIYAPSPELEKLDIDAALILPTLFRVVDAWGLTNAQIARLLGLDSESTVYAWRKGATRIGSDKIERIGHILWIYEMLHSLFGEGPASDGWPKRPNDGAPFNGRRPVEMLCSGRFADIVKIYEALFRKTQGW
jgi:uncharacterized protein (DUF2384 family)